MAFMKTSPKAILIHPDAKTDQEVISALFEPAKELGYVNDQYKKSILVREEEYPTGLQMPIPLAIPHIADGCEESFVAIAVLDEPVAFKAMDGSTEPVEAELVFMFGIVDPESQVEVLSLFAQSFTNIEHMTALKEAKSSEEALAVFKDIMGDTVEVEE